ETLPIVLTHLAHGREADRRVRMTPFWPQPREDIHRSGGPGLLRTGPRCPARTARGEQPAHGVADTARHDRGLLGGEDIGADLDAERRVAPQVVEQANESGQVED